MNSLMARSVHREHRVSNRILLVDDDSAVIRALGAAIALRGYLFDTARELEQAEAMLLVDSYGLVLSDVLLKGPSVHHGLELARFVRERCPGTLCILMTGSPSPELESEARRRGVEAVLAKPIPLSYLFRRLPAPEAR